MRIKDWEFEEETETTGPKLVAVLENGQCLNLVAPKGNPTVAPEFNRLLASLKQHVVVIEPD